MSEDPPSTDDLAARLHPHRGALQGFVHQRAGGLLRYEDLEDLVQGVFARALAGAANYRHESDEALAGWLITLAQRHLDDRRAHWGRIKRGAGRVLRYTTTAGTSAGGLPLPAMSGPGPRTRAESREQLILVTKALNTLPERDRQLVRWASEGLSLREQAERLGLGYEATQRAGHRAHERFRLAFRLLEG